MNAGRELDALVAEKVMGWKRITDFPVGSGKPVAEGWVGYWDGEWFRWFERPDLDEDEEIYGYWAPSTDIAAAWEVVEKLASVVYETEDTTWSQTVDIYSCPSATNCWHCKVSRDFADEPWEEILAGGDSPAHAICLAALKAVDAEVPA